jgi:aspartyl-tRNA synthetase
VADELTILNRSEVPPFPVEGEVKDEDLQLTYRYYDLRRPLLARNLRLRHRVTKATRDYLDTQGFLEIETPILSKSTPEGARDFLVPSRIWPGKFYALPQAPQQYKQLLMVGGMEKYFQIAKCFRDEDLRADRQLEFTQIDIEASFVRPEDIFQLTEGMLAAIFKATHGIEVPTPFQRLGYHEAVDTFGSDKPDRRFALPLVELSDVFRESSFKVFRGTVDRGGVIKAINAKASPVLPPGKCTNSKRWRRNSAPKAWLRSRSKTANGNQRSPSFYPTPNARRCKSDSELKKAI